MKKKQCAVCSDKCQTNIKLLWERFRDKKRFHICLACAEANKVNENTVQIIVTKTHTTIEE